MAQQHLDGSQRSFRLYITHVDGDGPFLKVSGQLNKQFTGLVESRLESARASFDNGTGTVSPASITEGLICAAKYKDDTYYRAKVLSINNISSGLVNVHFIDYGNKDVVSLSAIRFLDSCDALLKQVRAQCTDFYVSKLVQTSGRWEEPVLLKLQSLLCYSEYTAVLESNSSTIPIISVQFEGTDLAEHLGARRYAMVISVARQEVLVMKYTKEKQGLSQGRANFTSEPTEHVPFLGNQVFPSNPASAMRLQQNEAYNGNYMPPPSAISQRLTNKAPRAVPVNIRVPQRSPNQPISMNPSTLPPTSVPPFLSKLPSPVKAMPAQELKTYQSRLLIVGSSHQVFVSYAEGGPEFFSVQLASDGKKLDALMDEINRQPHKSLQEPPMIGTVCLGRMMSNERMIRRAIVTSVTRQKCQLFFVDFGDTEQVSYYDMFDIPEKYLQPYVFAMRFCLSQVKKLPKNGYMNELFQRLVNNKLLTLKVVPAEAPPLLQYGELYLDGTNVFDILYESMKDTPQCKASQPLAVGSRCSVLVSYVDSCLKFFIQLSDKIDELNDVMDGVKKHCESSPTPGELPVGAACCAKFPGDGNWYRATVLAIDANKTSVSYIDYGNEQDVDVSDLRTITHSLMELPAQALKCALMGYEDKAVERTTSKQLEMFAMGKTLLAHVTGMLSDTMLVSLLDDSVNPPLDIATSMNQLSQPTSTQQAPESISDDMKKGFRKEKSFKDNRESRDGDEDFGQRGGSFRRETLQNRGAMSTDAQDRSENESWFDRRDDRGERSGRRVKWEDGKERDNKADRGESPPRTNATPRDRANTTWEDRKPDRAEDDKSDRSFGSDGTEERSGRATPFKSGREFTEVQYKNLTDPVPLETAFEEHEIEPNAQHEVSVTWIISPHSFYAQIQSSKSKFLQMMHKIPEIYKGVKPFTGNISVGASVLAKYPEDGVLYRATVISVQPFRKFIVQYIDFGNKFLVDGRDIWQLDRELMELPKMAVHCSLIGVSPKEGEWKPSSDVDLCFNAPRYQCVFQDSVEGKRNVCLWNNDTSVADLLVEKQLAVVSEYGAAVTKDEAIDLSIIVGQEITCRVTNVVSFDKFYIQLDLQRAALVEEAISNFDVSLLAPLSADSLADDVHCTVRHDGKIYRAILNDTSQTDDIKAVLPDYGISITTSLENLMILPCELAAYHYQSVECCLNNYTEESEKLMDLHQLKQKLTNNKFIIYINRVDDVRLVTTVYQATTGSKVPIFSPDWDAYDSVSPLCAHAMYNYTCGPAYVAHTEALHLIYLQRSATGHRLTATLDSLYHFYQEGTPEPLTEYEEGGLCAVLSSDGNWYRAIITSSTENECTVRFPDYGNCETIAKESINKLDPQFYEPCAMALLVSLGLNAVSDDALSKFKEWTEEKEVQVTVSFGDEGWLASLYLNGVDLALKLVDENLATPRAVDDAQIETIAEEPTSLPPGGCTKVYISHIDTPGHFWLQMADKVDAIDEIQAELQEKANSYENVVDRDIGVICAAKYSADELWYRAEILDSDADITTVRFTDYGNTDVLDNVPGLLKSLPDHLKSIDPYVMKASVNAVPTGCGQWSEPSADYFIELVGDMSEPVDAMIVLKDVVTYVDIYVCGRNLTDKLVERGHATRTEVGGDPPSCFASHVNTPSEFWIQLETATSELQAMEDSMVDAEHFPELTVKEEGVICAAKYPEDGAWYRARVIADGSEGTEVLFIDYGNSSITTELKSLPEELKTKPALSRKCALRKPRDIEAWSHECEVKFNELAAEGATMFDVEFIASGDVCIVELYLNGKSVTEDLVELCVTHPDTERPAPVARDLRVSGGVCHFTSHDEFYVHIDADRDMETVVDKLIDAEEFQPATELEVGSVCAALWEEDGQWYRAKVLELSDVGAHVQFIDYGNKAKCELFKQLPDDITALEAIAKCCTIGGQVSEEGNKRFEKMCAENPTFQIELLDSTVTPVLVKLTLDGENVSSIIRKADATNDEPVKTVKTEPGTVLADTEQGITDSDNKNYEEILNSSNADEFQEASGEMNAYLSENLKSDDTGHHSLESALDQDILMDDDNDATGNKDQDKKEPEKISNKFSDLDTLESSDNTIRTPEKDSSSISEGYTSCTELDETTLKDNKDDAITEKMNDNNSTVEGDKLPVETSADGDKLPGETSADGDKLPVETSADGDKLPVETSADGYKLPVETSADGYKLPVETSADGDELPVETSEDGDELPVETSEDGDKLPVETSADGYKLPVETSADGDELPVETSEDGDKLPVETSEDGDELPVETSEDGDKLPVETSADGDKLPVETSADGDKLPGETSADGDKLSVETSADGDKLPVETSADGDKLPGETSADGDKLSVETSADGDKLPVETSADGDKLPVETSADGDELPVETSADGDELPVETSEDGYKLPVETSADGDKLPVETSADGDELPVETSEDGDELPVETSAENTMLKEDIKDVIAEKINDDMI